MNAPAEEERGQAEAVVVPLRSRRMARAEAMLAGVDGVSALTLALEARERLERGGGAAALSWAEGGAAALGWAELAVAALLVVATVTMLRGRRHFGRWVSGLAGVVLLLDGLSKTYGPKGHPSWALTLNGLLLLALVLLAPRIEARRRALSVLRLDGEGLSFRRSRLRRFAVPRAEIAALSVDAHAASVRASDGRVKRIDLGDLRNRDEVEAALRSWAAAHGVPVNGGADPS